MGTVTLFPANPSQIGTIIRDKVTVPILLEIILLG